jgi:hypothetical protein
MYKWRLYCILTCFGQDQNLGIYIYTSFQCELIVFTSDSDILTIVQISGHFCLFLVLLYCIYHITIFTEMCLVLLPGISPEVSQQNFCYNLFTLAVNYLEHFFLFRYFCVKNGFVD